MVSVKPYHLPSSLLHDRLPLLLESTGEGIFGIDTEGACTFINRAGATMLGWDPQQILGCNMHELAHHSHANGSHYPESTCPIFNAFRQGLPCRIDSEYFWRADHTSFPVEYSSYPIVENDVVQGAVITFVDITARRTAEDALKAAHAVLEERVAERTLELSNALQQLRELTAYTHSIREEERTRIAREIHDELGSLLVALKMDVGWLNKRLSEQPQRSPEAAQAMRDAMRAKCSNMSQHIENAVNNVGRIITDLRPSILDHQGLWAALHWQAHEFAHSAELNLEWHMDVHAAPPLPENYTSALFRVFQEMLSNVGRHAQARSLQIEITADTHAIQITLQNNGKGADIHQFEAPDAYGVMGMRERVRHLGGSLSIVSIKGQGTRLSLHIPLQ